MKYDFFYNIKNIHRVQTYYASICKIKFCSMYFFWSKYNESHGA